jgi:multicopper oxidase
MDGVPGVTQEPVASGASFTYEFTVPDPGTYFFHAHVGVQLDRGLYGTLLVVVLDDWTDGVGRSPPATRWAATPATCATRCTWSTTAHPGRRGRWPVIASPSPTPTASWSGRSPAMRCWSAWVSATTPWSTSATAPSRWSRSPRARAPGRPRSSARAGGPTPRLDSRPAELDGRLLTAAGLRPAAGVDLGAREPARTHRLVLAGDMQRYRWTINGRTFDRAVPLEVRDGERVRLVFDNRSMMFHPMHLHGHTFQVRDGGRPGPRKDTVVIRPMRRVTVDLEAANPGQWVVPATTPTTRRPA